MQIKKSLTYGDALKHGGKTAFTVMVKPVGSLCNLNCSYCYYLDKDSQGRGADKVMSDTILEELILQQISANDVPVVNFCWHGGEPLIAGLDFFRKVMGFQRKYAAGKQIENSIQTNGTLLNDEWCRFLAENNFLTGISIDGPRHIHDANRLTSGGGASFDDVMRGVEFLKGNGAEFNTLTAVSRTSEGHGAEIYRFLKSIGSRYMQFLPVLEYAKEAEGSPRQIIAHPGEEGARAREWSISGEGYGRLLTDIFDQWVISDVGNYFVQIFDATLAGWCSMRPGVCTMCETCGDSLVVERNGDVYSCDHFVYPEFRLGNVTSDDLRNLYKSRRHFDFSISKRENLPLECRRCSYLRLCRGECPKHRFTGSGFTDELRVNNLCEGLKRFFKYSAPYMEYMKGLLERGETAAAVMPVARRMMGLPF